MPAKTRIADFRGRVNVEREVRVPANSPAAQANDGENENPSSLHGPEGFLDQTKT